MTILMIWLLSNRNGVRHLIILYAYIVVVGWVGSAASPAGLRFAVFALFPVSRRPAARESRRHLIYGYC